MTMMPRSVLAETPTGERPAARASTKYMETFQLFRPALGGTDISTFANKAGNLDLYTIGTNDEVFRLRRGEGAEAPYHELDLNITGRQLYLYTSSNEGSDTPNILTLGGNGRLRLAEYKPGTGSYFQQETSPEKATEAIRQFKGARGATGNIYVNVMLDVPGTDYGLLANNFFKPGSNDWAGPVWAPVMGPGGTQAEVKAIAVVENSTVQSAIFAIGRDNEVLFSETSDRTSSLRVLGPKKATALSVVVDQDDRLAIFAVEKDSGKLLLKREKKYQAGTIKQFDDWIYVDPGQTVALTSVYASQCFNDLLQVFGIGTDGRLWRAAEVPGSGRRADPVWNTLFPLGNEIPTDPGSEATIFTLGRDLAGYAEAYTVSAGGDLTRFWQSSTTQQWFEESIELFRGDNEMVPVQTHALELVVLDDGGMPASFVPVSIQASSLVTLFVDGRSYRCSQLNRVMVETGPNGKVVIYQKANALAAATLYVETPSTLAGSPLVVEPNRQLQAKLGALTVDEIKNAKDASGAYLLPAEYRSSDEYAQSLQKITEASMQIAAQDEAGGGDKISFLFVSRRNAARGFNPRLNLAALEGTSWAIDFTSGFPQYVPMTSAEVAEWKSSRLKAMGADVGGFLGIGWGDVWNGIKNFVGDVVDKLTRIVVEVVEGIGRVLFEIGGKVFEAIIEFAQQAFDFVQGVWNWLKVKLEQLFEWLAFLFNIGDFVRTAEAVRHSVDVLLDFTVDGVETVKQTILSGIDTMKDNLQATVDDFLKELNKQDNPTFDQFSSQQPMTEEQSYQMEHNLFANAYEQNGGQAGERGATTVSLMTSSALSSSLEGLLKMLEDLANDFQYGEGKEAFNEAIEYFTAIGDDPNNALNLLMSGIVKVMESVALYALDAAKTVIATLMDLIKEVVESFRDLLFAEWEIPVLSQLYKFFTGKSLSIRVIDIAAYLVAIPGTLIYKLATGKAPFPDQAALDAYKDYVTVDWIKSKFGIPTSRKVVYNSTLETVVACVSLGVYSGAMFVRIFTDTLTGVFSATALVKPDTPTKIPDGMKNYVGKWTPGGKLLAGGVSVLMRYVTTIFTMPWLIRPGAPAPSCPAGDPGFAGTIWICQVIAGPTRGLLVLKLPAGRARVYTGELTITLWGWANFGMVVWNYCASPKKDTVATLGLARALCNIIPGQGTRALFVPDIQEETYFVPAIIGEVLLVVGYLGSIGVAVAELVEIAEGGLQTADGGSGRISIEKAAHPL
ncbi:hypothetical protein [Stappia indica]|uniref:hypothetical protein n=1 Tax=Stappia indica TaxID=538381 RepID=UPI001CD67327|nr:hypothetical protein [Stappia indica]MCA1299343.1 hypothetical protein [Stappia indica]